MEGEKKEQKAWTTPTLTPIVRRKPEEGILSNCKTGQGSGAPTGVFAVCYEEGCSGCQFVAAT